MALLVASQIFELTVSNLDIMLFVSFSCFKTVVSVALIEIGHAWFDKG